MRREPTELPFSGPSTRRPYAPEPDEDRQISFSAGRAYLRETPRYDLDYSITAQDRLVIDQRRLEAAEDRQARNDANFAIALRVGEAFKVLQGDG